jgi:twitching motility protein PilT
MEITEILHEGVRRGASDIILSAWSPVTFHVHGVLEPYDASQKLTPADTERLAYSVLGSDRRKEFEQERELDMAFHIPDLSRFRVSVYRQKGTIAAVLRVVPFHIPHYTDIGVSDRLLMQMVNTPGGLILITGPTGAGKSTTIASFLNFLNTEHDVAKHVITIEDPIEFVLPSQVCIVDQRELGSDTKSYARGLRSALRQMPHIIFVGEMRDRETIEIALTAAETGNIVVSTMATASASKTVNRIIDVFPVEHQSEIRTRLSLSLRMVISQVLLRRSDSKGRIAGREIMFVNNAIANLVRDGKIHQVNNVISGSADEGMVLMDDSLMELFDERIVDAASVITRIQDPEKIRRLVRAA